MEEIDMEQYRAGLLLPSAREARRSFCQDSAECLKSTGNVLWCFGLPSEPKRRALSIVLQIGASLVRGAVATLQSENWYASCALLRQVVEVEYLVWLFSRDTAEAAKWLAATDRDLRTLFSPATMRKRSGGIFRDQEYWDHCTIGGHPNPTAAFLLDEHMLPRDRDPMDSGFEWLWVDLATHLNRLWLFVSDAVHAHGLEEVGIASKSLLEVNSLREQWLADDLCARHFPGMPNMRK